MVSTSARQAGDPWFDSGRGTADFVRQFLYVYIFIYIYIQVGDRA